MKQKPLDKIIPDAIPIYQGLSGIFPSVRGTMLSYLKDAFYPQKDVKIEELVRAVQERHGTNFAPDELYFITYFFITHQKNIEKYKGDRLYEKIKISREEYIQLFNLLTQIQSDNVKIHSGKVTIKTIETTKKNKIETSETFKFSFTSDEIINLFLKGLCNVFLPFIGRIDFKRIAEDIKNENKNLYKSGKNNDVKPFHQRFFKDFKQYINLDEALESKSDYPNKQMQFIAELLRPADLIDYRFVPLKPEKPMRDFLIGLL